jgi:membrane-associated phospholipid phosphatase
MVAAGVLAPLVRRRLNSPPLVTQAIAFGAPVGLSIAVRRSRTRDVAVCSLQMWAYLAAYKMPHDDATAQQRRVRIEYPVRIDRLLGRGELPTVRLQRRLAMVGADGPQWTTLDRTVVWAHWMWFMVPHGALAYVLVRHPRRFPRSAVMTYAVFDLGAIVYWLVPTAPPWYAALTHAQADGEELAVRRMMVEYGQSFWGDGWDPLYSVLGGNPLAAMPSLHFATSVMAALLLTEAEPLAGAIGWAYALTLGFALVYLGEHYVVDLLAGAGLTLAVKRLGPGVAPLVARVGQSVAALEAKAHEMR